MGFGAAQEPASSPVVDRVGQTGFVQLQAESFASLPLKDKVLAYWLSMAAIALHPVVFDQNSTYGLTEKRLLEQILTHGKGIDPEVLRKLTDYTKLLWANRGNRNAFTSRKFLPDFTFEELKAAAVRARRNGARLGPAAQLQKTLEELRRPIFDPDFEPMLTVKNPVGGQDRLEASANNLYQGVRLGDLEGFAEKYALNSRLVKKDGKLVEQVYRTGTPDGKVPPGLYAAELGRVIRYLRLAMPYAPASQRKVLSNLIRYYQTGDPADWRQFNIDWVRDDSPIDFTNGFIEVYKDARGRKGAAQAYVTVVDKQTDKLMQNLAAQARYFEQHAPWEDKYKLDNPHPPVAKAVEALIETGDFDITTVGENLPNETEIHDHYGSKSFIFTGSARALAQATGTKVVREFAYSEDEIARAEKHRELASTLLVAMHEVIGHGSGKMNPQLKEEPAFYLKEYYSTLEEARADLVALWYFFDPKLIEMGAMPDLEVAKTAYDAEVRASLVQLREVPTGETLEEDHRRGTQLIVSFIRDKTGAIEPVEREGRIYLVVKDYAKMREGVGLLLAELMRIKAEGDYAAAQALVSRYGVRFDPSWRDQVVERYRRLDLPIFWTAVNPDLQPRFGKNGTIVDVEIVYPRDIVKQQLRYVSIAGR
jgi:dipeptidyl-peptidase-3